MRAIENAMVAREREHHRVARHDCASARHRHVTDGAGRQRPDCGGMISGVRVAMSKTTESVTVNVAPDISGGVSAPSRARAASSASSRAISDADFASASKIVGTT